MNLAIDEGKQLRLRTIGVGMVVGELGVYTGNLATASVVAEKPARDFFVLQRGTGRDGS